MPPEAENKSVIWSSDNSNVATVNPNSGLVVAQSEGTARIYATAADGSGKSGRCEITVNPAIPVSWVTISPTSKTLSVGEAVNLTAIICPEDATNKEVVWSSSNPSVASVDVLGCVCANGLGVATITATTEDGSLSDYFTIVSLYAEYPVIVERHPIYAQNMLAMIDAIRGLPENKDKYEYRDRNGDYVPEYNVEFNPIKMYIIVEQGECLRE